MIVFVSNPLESDVEVTKVDWVVPPSIDTQLIDGVALLNDHKVMIRQRKSSQRVTEIS